MSRTLISTALSFLAAMALGACSEKPPRPDPEGGCFIFFLCYGRCNFNFIEIDRAQMNTSRHPAQTGRQAPGVIARALRTPRTLAFPGLAR